MLRTKSACKVRANNNKGEVNLYPSIVSTTIIVVLTYPWTLTLLTQYSMQTALKISKHAASRPQVNVHRYILFNMS